jgi:hypothetical protein
MSIVWKSVLLVSVTLANAADGTRRVTLKEKEGEPDVER